MNKYNEGYSQAIEDVIMFLSGYFAVYIGYKVFNKTEIDRLLDKLKTLKPE